MDECKRLWTQHQTGCHDSIGKATERVTNANKEDAVEEADAARRQFVSDYRTRADTTIAELEKVLQDFEQGMSKAWSEAVEENLECSILWSIGQAQLSVAQTYSWMHGALRC